VLVIDIYIKVNGYYRITPSYSEYPCKSWCAKINIVVKVKSGMGVAGLRTIIYNKLGRESIKDHHYGKVHRFRKSANSKFRDNSSDAVNEMKPTEGIQEWADR
jgi:hypothetical protein